MRAALEGLAGIVGVEVDLSHDAFTVTYDASRVAIPDIRRVITALGFKSRLARPGDSAETGRGRSSTSIPEPISRELVSARTSGRLVLLNFHADWCAPCKVLDRTILTNPAVRRALRDFILLRVDTDELPEAGGRYRIEAMPTLLVLDWDGVELFRSVGLSSPEDLALALSRTASEKLSGDQRRDGAERQ